MELARIASKINPCYNILAQQPCYVKFIRPVYLQRISVQNRDSSTMATHVRSRITIAPQYKNARLRDHIRNWNVSELNELLVFGGQRTVSVEKKKILLVADPVRRPPAFSSGPPRSLGDWKRLQHAETNDYNYMYGILLWWTTKQCNAIEIHFVRPLSYTRGLASHGR